jgi:thiol-disulfide isomerase/thioredoxin
MRTGSIFKTLVAVGAFVAGLSQSFAADIKAYDAAAFKAAQDAGANILIHVTAPWCPTCKAQHTAIEDLNKKADYADLKVFSVDFDSQKPVWTAWKVNSQSTIIAFKGANETGRIVGQSKADAVEALAKTAVK